jgi:hypothetical protein
MKKFVLLAFCAIGMAQADIIPMLVSNGVNCGITGGTYQCEYNYEAQLHDDARLLGDQAEHVEYFTIYDFNGYIGGTASGPSGWTPSSANLGLTEWEPAGDAPFDDPSVANVTFRYTGSGVAAGSNLGNFTISSTIGPEVIWGRFSSQATHTNSDRFVRNTGWVQIPVPGGGDTTIPEPMTMGLIGSGLAGLGLFRRFRS